VIDMRQTKKLREVTTLDNVYKYCENPETEYFDINEIMTHGKPLDRDTFMKQTHLTDELITKTQHQMKKQYKGQFLIICENGDVYLFA
jgi:hypothetical protein